MHDPLRPLAALLVLSWALLHLPIEPAEATTAAAGAAAGPWPEGPHGPDLGPDPGTCEALRSCAPIVK